MDSSTMMNINKRSYRNLAVKGLIPSEIHLLRWFEGFLKAYHQIIEGRSRISSGLISDGRIIGIENFILLISLSIIFFLAL